MDEAALPQYKCDGLSHSLASDATGGKEEPFGTVVFQRREPQDGWYEMSASGAVKIQLGAPNT